MYPLLISSIILFYLGTCFAFFVVFPILFEYIPKFAPAGVVYMPDISNYLNFILKLFFAFGMAFEVPIATILLAKAGVMSIEDMSEKRPYIIVGAFCIGMLLTPPDPISQSLLALPIWLLFEAGLFMARFFVNEEEINEEE
jgi:sec-independent protein translocase protein TatC